MENIHYLLIDFLVQIPPLSSQDVLIYPATEVLLPLEQILMVKQLSYVDAKQAQPGTPTKVNLQDVISKLHWQRELYIEYAHTQLVCDYPQSMFSSHLYKFFVLAQHLNSLGLMGKYPSKEMAQKAAKSYMERILGSKIHLEYCHRNATLVATGANATFLGDFLIWVANQE